VAPRGERSFVVTIAVDVATGATPLTSWMRETIADGLLLEPEDVRVIENEPATLPAGDPHFDPLWDRYLDGDR